MFDTSFCFKPGKLTICADGGAGSSGKGKVGSFICHHADNWQFACNTFAPNSGHTVVLDNGDRYFYQTLNSCAYLADRYEKLYIGPGATIDFFALIRELDDNKIPKHKLGISPLAAVLQDQDGAFERGQVDFDGNPLEVRNDNLAKTGTTAHGCGACRARRVLRRPEAKFAKDYKALQGFLCDVPGEIMARLDRGQAGLLEVAQGFQLSYLLPQFYPFSTSRNCTVAAALDDLMVPPCYAGDVVLNFRTYPIRINSKKYINKQNGDHLTWAAYQDIVKTAIESTTAKLPDGPLLDQVQTKVAETVDVVEGNSGPGYADQSEISWDQITRDSGSPADLTEFTSVTKLPRRVFTFSSQNLWDAVRHNRTGHNVYLSLNFVNYLDHRLCGASSVGGALSAAVPPKVRRWLADKLMSYVGSLRFLGTGPHLSDMIQLNRQDCDELMSLCLGPRGAT